MLGLTSRHCVYAYAALFAGDRVVINRDVSIPNVDNLFQFSFADVDLDN